MKIKYTEIMALALEAKQLQEEKIFSYEGRIQSKALGEPQKEFLKKQIRERQERLEEINKTIDALSEFEVEGQQ